VGGDLKSGQFLWEEMVQDEEELVITQQVE
jgi:hypothetical protein